MPLEFFNFGSHEAFYLFRWITTERKEILEALIAKAFERAEVDDMFQAGKAPCLCARDALAEHLSEEFLPREFEQSGLFSDFGFNPQDGADNLRSISEQLLVLASNRICYVTVAEAILRYCGKWAPDTDRPEIH